MEEDFSFNLNSELVVCFRI